MERKDQAVVAEDLVAFQKIIEILLGFEHKDRQRIINMVVIFLDLNKEADDA